MPNSPHSPQGTLGDRRPPRLLCVLARKDFTGVLRVATSPTPSLPTAKDDTDGAEIIREIHFQGGHIAWAISTNPEESLKGALLRAGALSEDQWEKAEDVARQRTIRQTLTELKMIEEDDLYRLEKSRVEQIILALFNASDGKYTIRERRISPGTPDLEISPVALVLRGALKNTDRTLIEQEVGPLDSIYEIKPGILEDAVFDQRGEYETVLCHLDGKTSVGEICARTSLPETYVNSLLVGLRLAGALEPTAMPPPTTSPAPESVTQPEVPSASEPADPASSDRPPITPYRPTPTPSEDPLEWSELISTEGGNSVYAAPEGRKPQKSWMVLSSAVAVGLAALLLILLSQDRGDAVVLQPAEISEEPVFNQVPVADTRSNVETKVDPPPAPVILTEKRSTTEPGQQDLMSGNLAVAARQFEQSLSSKTEIYTIQLVLACRDSTIRNIVADAGNAHDLFLLKAPFKGRACYRLFWGQYRTRGEARRSLQNDIPVKFRAPGGKAWVTRLGGT